MRIAIGLALTLVFLTAGFPAEAAKQDSEDFFSFLKNKSAAQKSTSSVRKEARDSKAPAPNKASTLKIPSAPRNPNDLIIKVPQAPFQAPTIIDADDLPRPQKKKIPV